MNRIVVTEVVERSLIKKMHTRERRSNYYFDLNDNALVQGDNLRFADLLSDIQKLCDAYCLDFAAIDVVKSDENKYYIIDVNPTPY